jgi:arylsulfatase A-like enzyme
MNVLTLTMVGVLLNAEVAEPQSVKPNVLIILSDDVGWGEYGFQGGTDVPTPHIDSIARDGVKFTQGYVSGPYCSPTRAGLMTGRYQTRFGHEFNSVARQKGLPLSEVTIADRLRAAGYATAAIGKWHLGEAPEYRPTQRGFDEFYGTLANTPFYHPNKFVDSRESPDVQKIDDPGFYTTEKYAERAVDWIRGHRDRPWFLYLPFNAQHAPLQAPDKYLSRFSHIGDEKRRTFAAMMSALDDAVGAVLGAIHETGADEKTLVFFLSDNGGPTNSTTSQNGGLRGFKATTWEGGVRVPFAARWTGQIPAGRVYEQPIIQLDILPTALAAAGVSTDATSKLDGANLLPYLTGETAGRPHDALYWRFGPQWAIRHGDWKLVAGREEGIKEGLFNLADDRNESRDLSSTHPEKVAELKALWTAWNAEQIESIVPDQPARQRNQEGRPRRNSATESK